MISKNLEISLNQALRTAQEWRHQYATVEHLLLALLDNPEVSTILLGCGADLSGMSRDLRDHLDNNVPVFAEDREGVEITPTLAFQRVIQRAVYQVQSAGKSMVTGPYVLVAMFGEKDSHASFYLQKQNISRLDIQTAISHGDGDEVVFDSDEDTESAEGEAGTGRQDAPGHNPMQRPKRVNPLKAYTVNLNKKAEKGKIDPLIGREKEIQRTLQILCRRRKNNPIFVGEAGVGKTHLAEGLALKLYQEEVPELLADSVIFSLDMGSLLAGTKFRGDFESRLKGVIRALKKKPGAVLFIDEIHTVIGAGSTSGSTMDASNLLKPLLASGEIRCIGSTTFEEYRGIFEKDRALARRFQKIDVPEPTMEETVRILKGLKGHYEEHHGIRYTAPALQSAAELSGRHISDRKHPDSAIDVIDEAGSAMRLLPPSRQRKSIGVKEVEDVVARMARIPPRTVTRDDREILRTLGSNIKLSLYGQDKAVEQVVEAIKLSRSGLGNPEKPVGSFLFAGPTGVGKTELARLLGLEMGVELIRFDMSEYMERHTVSRLIGAPPGYVGFDQGGLLTDAVHKSPHAVLLLDEIEKAHPDVFNLLLQVMDHGTLTDNNGRSTDFHNVALIMTTNAGAQDLDRPSVGFVTQSHAGDDMKEIKRIFTPEFRNRLDAIVSFGPLNTAAISRVVDKFILRLESDLDQKKVSLDVTETARDWLAENGYDPKFGARPMERLIKKEIRRKLADELLFGSLAQGGSVVVDESDGSLELECLERGES
ncbi:MAG: ATP-dependent Clp protease ATP-binding subunit ClpA [Magnetococcales bacterium]|nr:ATP-dependent Clp protease ATP-binding subunit ClpA [Magnetococcales bacterium]